MVVGVREVSGCKKIIPLVLGKVHVEQKSDDRPWEFETTWLEVSEGKITDEYRVTSQGANIYGFVYKNYNSGKQFDFVQDIGAMSEDGCTWE